MQGHLNAATARIAAERRKYMQDTKGSNRRPAFCGELQGVAATCDATDPRSDGDEGIRTLDLRIANLTQPTAERLGNGLFCSILSPSKQFASRYIPSRFFAWFRGFWRHNSVITGQRFVEHSETLGKARVKKGRPRVFASDRPLLALLGGLYSRARLNGVRIRTSSKRIHADGNMSEAEVQAEHVG